MSYDFYKNNPLLKRVGTKHNFTLEQTSEIIKCKEDPVHFIRNYCKIVSLDSEEPIPFDLFQYQERFIRAMHNNRRVISMQPRQMGKALDIETEIPTIDGFKRMADIQVGDMVFGMDGVPTKVTFKSEIHNKPTYKIVFSDESEVLACEDHLWFGYIDGEEQIFSTKDIASSSREFSIPICSPVEYESKEYVIDPYILGLCLGNSLPYATIPDAYLQGSVDQRRRLLQGLLESGGKIVGGFEAFITKDKKLLIKVRELVESLGYKVTLNTDTVYFSLGSNQRYVIAIGKIETRPTQCITVDNSSHTFLCTRNYIVTHNTQVVAAYICWFITFQANQTVAILANKSDASREILSRCKFMYEFLPNWMQHGVKKWNEGSILLENGSKAFTGATSKSGLRGRSVNMLYVDETSSVPNNIADEFFTAIYPIVSSGKNTKIILTSTPIGYNHFWKFWNDALKGVNGFVPVEVHYWEHPKRDEKWAAEQKQLLGDVKFNQEVNCQFLGSSNTLINGDTLTKLSSKDYVWQKNNFDAIEEPIKNHIYFLSVDTSEGIGGDYSTFHVIDITEFPYLSVGKYRCNTVSYLLFPNIIHQYAKKYNDAFVLIEINGIGNQVAHILYEDLEYENVLMVSQKAKDGQFLSIASSANYGVKTTKQVKRLGCQALKTLIEEQKLLVFDEDTIREFSTFIETKGTFKADEGYNDDLVMPLVTFAWASQDNMFKDITNVDTRKMIFENRMKEIDDEMLPVGFYSNGEEGEEVVLSNF